MDRKELGPQPISAFNFPKSW